MFEQYKLNKYQEYIKAFVYDVVMKNENYYIQTYIVLKDDGDYEYIKFTKTKVTYREYYKKAISDLKKNGYKPLAQFVEEEHQRKVEHSKKLTRAKFNIIK